MPQTLHGLTPHPKILSCQGIYLQSSLPGYFPWIGNCCLYRVKSAYPEDRNYGFLISGTVCSTNVKKLHFPLLEIALWKGSAGARLRPRVGLGMGTCLGIKNDMEEHDNEVKRPGFKPQFCHLPTKNLGGPLDL